MLLKLFSAAGAALAAACAFAFAAPQVAQAATAPSYYLCQMPTIFIWLDQPIHIQPCYDIALGSGSELQHFWVKTTLEALYPGDERVKAGFYPVYSAGWWDQIAQRGGFENNTTWHDQQGQSQTGYQCYWLTWAQRHPWGNFSHYWRVRVDFAWGAPFTYTTNPVPAGYVGTATLYQYIGYL
jgi:hypothetical protein